MAGLFGVPILLHLFNCCGRREEAIEGEGRAFKRMQEEESMRTAKLAAQRTRYGQFQTNPRPYSAAV